MVIFPFLRNISATLIPSIALPMSIVGTFAVMYELNYTVDNLSLMALTLSVGFVVDDAIVMLENIVRHMEMGEGVMDAAMKGSREIGFTILSMTMSLVAVFIPVLFHGWDYRPAFARVCRRMIMAAILVSGFVSLTLTPMLCSRFLRSQHGVKHGWMYSTMERFFDRLLRGYDRSLQWSLRHRLTVMSVAGIIFVATAWQFVGIPKGFLPDVDSSQLRISTEASQGISFDAMKAHQKEISDIISRDPNRLNYFASLGGPAGTINAGFVFVHLKEPPDRPKVPSKKMLALERKYGKTPVLGSLLRAAAPLFIHHPDANDVMDELRPKFAAVPGINVYMQNPPPIQLGGRPSKSQYQFTLQSPDTEELYRQAAKFQVEVAKLPGLADVTSDLLVANPQVNVNIDRDKAAALGVTAQQVENALFAAYGQRQITTIYAPNDEYWVVMELEDQYQRDPSALALLYIRSSTGSLVPLNAVANLSTGVGPLSVNHQGQLPAVTISFNLATGAAIGDAVNEITALARRQLPLTVSTQFQGTAGIPIVPHRPRSSSAHRDSCDLPRPPEFLRKFHPSADHSFWASIRRVWRTVDVEFGYELDLYGFVGIIMLIGIVKKNAIMMVDFAIGSTQRPQNGCGGDLRGLPCPIPPIMMTTMAALMGTAPIAFGIGSGANSRRSLGLAVVGGLIFSQLVTLYLTPVFYTYMDTFQSWLERRFGMIAGKRVPTLAEGSTSAD